MFSKYNYVYQVYKEGSFTRAAEKLFISQPSLSAAIKNIEQKLGADIFERTNGGVRLTEVGQEYISAAEKIMNVEKEFVNKISDIYNLETGHITVGGTNYLSSYVLPRIVNRFAALYPKIDVTLVEANSTSLHKMIKNEQIDIIIDSFDETMDEYEKYLLASERILLCVPEDRPINKSLCEFQIYPDSIYNGTVCLDEVKSVPIEVFKDEKFVLLKSGNDMYNRAMSIFDKYKVEPKVVFSVDQLNISYALVDSGMGLCFATDTLFKYGKFRNNVVLYNVGQEHCSRMLYVAHKKNKYCSRAMSEFIRVAKDVIADKDSFA
ncbi:MAG: LysR family transcriptional regulator [Clostridia bacterium]|nr:LysR family transcriptional regulator [Clostridia bacterium]